MSCLSVVWIIRLGNLVSLVRNRLVSELEMGWLKQWCNWIALLPLSLKSHRFTIQNLPPFSPKICDVFALVPQVSAYCAIEFLTPAPNLEKVFGRISKNQVTCSSLMQKIFRAEKNFIDVETDPKETISRTRRWPALAKQSRSISGNPKTASRNSVASEIRLTETSHFGKLAKLIEKLELSL